MANAARIRAVPSVEDIRNICREEGAGDAGLVDIGRPALDAEREDILRAYPRTRTIIVLAFPMNPESIRSPARQLASDEIHHTSDKLALASRGILRRLNALGIRGATIPADFPMDMGRYPGKIWNVSHKVMAVEGGLGHMERNRLVIHPRFGNFIRLTSILIDAELETHDSPLPESCCDACGLCVAVCPVGAVRKDGSFDLVTCMTHAYRDNVRGLTDMLAALVEAKDMAAFRERFMDRETASMWQSLMYKMNYRCGYCMAVCPAGQAGSAVYAGQRKAFMAEVFTPLKNRTEEVYVLPGSPAEQHARKNVHKNIRVVGWGAPRP